MNRHKFTKMCPFKKFISIATSQLKVSIIAFIPKVLADHTLISKPVQSEGKVINDFGRDGGSNATYLIIRMAECD